MTTLIGLKQGSLGTIHSSLRGQESYLSSLNAAWLVRQQGNAGDTKVHRALENSSAWEGH